MPVVIDDAIAIRSMRVSGADLRSSPDRRRVGRPVHGQGEAGAGKLVRGSSLEGASRRRFARLGKSAEVGIILRTYLCCDSSRLSF